MPKDPTLEEAAQRIQALMGPQDRRRRRVRRLLAWAPEGDASQFTEEYVWLREHFSLPQIREWVKQELDGEGPIPPGKNKHGTTFIDTVRFIKGVAYLSRIAHAYTGGGGRELVGTQAESTRQSENARRPRKKDRLNIAIKNVLERQGKDASAKNILGALENDCTLIAGQTAEEIIWKPASDKPDTRTLRWESFESRVSKAEQKLP